MTRRLATSIVSRYPQPWRERYEGEVLELVAAAPVRLHDLGELARALIVERARALIEDTDHPGRTAAILVWMQPAAVILFMASAWAIGAGLRNWRGPLPSGVAEAGLVLTQLFCFSFLTTKYVLYRKTKARSRFGGPIFPAWAGFTLLPVLFAGIALGAWGQWAGYGANSFPVAFRLSMSMLIHGMFAAELTSAFWPGAAMLEALGRLAGSDSQIKWARLWIDGCETMSAKGIPSPLVQAQADLAQGQRNREQALEELHKLGYRARFQQPS